MREGGREKEMEEWRQGMREKRREGRREGVNRGRKGGIKSECKAKHFTHIVCVNIFLHNLQVSLC